MRVTLATPDGRVLACKLEHDQADRVTVSSCPGCGQESAEIRGHGVTHHDHDTFFARASCLACDAHVGTLRATVSTIFGIEEDRAVLGGRPRVY